MIRPPGSIRFPGTGCFGPALHSAAFPPHHTRGVAHPLGDRHALSFMRNGSIVNRSPEKSVIP